MALLQQQVKDQQNRYDAGTVPRFNVLQAEVALANAMPPLIQAQNAYRISTYQLVRLLGMDYPKGHPSEVPFNVVGTLGYSPRKIDTDDSIRVAIARNPSLKAQRQTILQIAANVNVQIAGWFPSINANAGYEFTNNLASQNLSNTVSGWFFGATSTWNVWDGGATYGRVTQAKAQLMQSKNNYDNGIRQVVLDVQQAISNLQQAQETIDSQTASVVQATEALRLSKERLDAGAGTQLDVLNAQVQLLTAQSNVLQARFDYIAAMSSYELALSLDTQYVETFEDPLVRPFNPQALNKTERTRFQKVTNPNKPQAKLPRAFAKEDPIQPILQGARRHPRQSKRKRRHPADRANRKGHLLRLGRAKLQSTDRHLPTTSRVPPPCPAEFFPALDALAFLRAAFIQRCPGIDVVTDRETALGRLWSVHRETANALGFSGMPFALAEQIHGNVVAQVDAPHAAPVAGADGLLTNRPGLCLAIYVADCAAVYLADREAQAIGLVHAGKKGTELGIVDGSNRNDAQGVRNRSRKSCGPGRPLHPPSKLRGRLRRADRSSGPRSWRARYL